MRLLSEFSCTLPSSSTLRVAVIVSSSTTSVVTATMLKTIKTVKQTEADKVSTQRSPASTAPNAVP